MFKKKITSHVVTNTLGLCKLCINQLCTYKIKCIKCLWYDNYIIIGKRSTQLPNGCKHFQSTCVFYSNSDSMIDECMS